MTIGDLEVEAGITDRAAFWMQFSHIRGTVKINGIERDASFEAGVAELHRLAAARSVASSRPGDMAAIYAEENGIDYASALVACNMD